MDEIEQTHLYLDQLREQQVALDKFLCMHRDVALAKLSPGVTITLRMYTQMLEDASKTVASLIEYFEHRN